MVYVDKDFSFNLLYNLLDKSRLAQWGCFTLDPGLSVITHFLCGRSQTRLQNAVELCNLDLDLVLVEIWIWWKSK